MCLCPLQECTMNYAYTMYLPILYCPPIIQQLIGTSFLYAIHFSERLEFFYNVKELLTMELCKWWNKEQCHLWILILKLHRLIYMIILLARLYVHLIYMLIISICSSYLFVLMQCSKWNSSVQILGMNRNWCTTINSVVMGEIIIHDSKYCPYDEYTDGEDKQHVWYRVHNWYWVRNKLW